MDKETLRRIQYTVMCAYWQILSSNKWDESNGRKPMFEITSLNLPPIQLSLNTNNVSKDDLSILQFWFNLMYKRYCFAYISIQKLCLSLESLSKPDFSVCSTIVEILYPNSSEVSQGLKWNFKRKEKKKPYTESTWIEREQRETQVSQRSKTK